MAASRCRSISKPAINLLKSTTGPAFSVRSFRSSPSISSRQLSQMGFSGLGADGCRSLYQVRRAYHAFPAPEGLKEIVVDYVHQEMTRNWILVCWRLFLLIVIKDGFITFMRSGDLGTPECISGERREEECSLSPQPVYHALSPAPVQSSSAGSMLGGLCSTIAQGMTFVTGSSVVHRDLVAVTGARTIKHETVVSEAVGAPAPAANSTGDACSVHSKAFQD